MRLIDADELLERIDCGDTTGIIEDDIKLAKTILKTRLVVDSVEDANEIIKILVWNNYSISIRKIYVLEDNNDGLTSQFKAKYEINIEPREEQE